MKSIEEMKEYEQLCAYCAPEGAWCEEAYEAYLEEGEE